MAYTYKFNVFTENFDQVLSTPGTTFGTGIMTTNLLIVRNVIEQSLTIPTGQTALHANTDIPTGIIVTVDGDMVII